MGFKLFTTVYPICFIKHIQRFICLLITTPFIFAASIEAHPFNYDLHLSRIEEPSRAASGNVMIMAHGMGGNYTINELIKINKTLISFNFPDYDCFKRITDYSKATFGSVEEILPLLYVIKETILVSRLDRIDLYGFSAGGGAIVNALGALNSTRFDDALKTIGIETSEKKQMLQAILKGIIILDTPLKSIEEIMAFKGSSPELELFAKRYRQNDMVPIESLKYLQGLKLNVVVHFQKPDEILSNRDDDLFIKELKFYNSAGSTKVIIGSDTGHVPPHLSLWHSLK